VRRTATERHIARTSRASGAWSRSTGSASDSLHPQLLFEGGSIIAGIDRLLGRTWDPRRLARWEALLDDSLLRAGGRARAMRRWQRAT
jgi:hypothetical protein